VSRDEAWHFLLWSLDERANDRPTESRHVTGRDAVAALGDVVQSAVRSGVPAKSEGVVDDRRSVEFLLLDELFPARWSARVLTVK